MGRKLTSVTSMHSSGMRTARRLTVSGGGGGLPTWGVCLLRRRERVVSAYWGGNNAGCLTTNLSEKLLDNTCSAAVHGDNYITGAGICWSCM